ncbi:unnamed protein product [Euphydryas editha]|uniref:Gustatory receptor n=1 Tax=Euphydryas editha TaxID=104508 RepID=A0AAU9UHP8_EUPED|nr:unnamed protein product [Euphydryas editha]
MLWIRMKSLKKAIECWTSSPNDVDDRRVKLQIKSLEEFLFIYRNILQSTKIISHTSKFLIEGIIVLDAVLKFLPLCIPALFGELVNAAVENIKINLARQFRICTNDALRNKILKAIKYIDICPIKITVWRLFTVDFSLSLAFFNFCTTYTIVLLQFKQVKI